MLPCLVVPGSTGSKTWIRQFESGKTRTMPEVRFNRLLPGPKPGWHWLGWGS